MALDQREDDRFSKADGVARLDDEVIGCSECGADTSPIQEDSFIVMPTNIIVAKGTNHYIIVETFHGILKD